MPGAACEWPEYPFCGKRCRTVDMGRWLGESYTIVAADQEPEREEEEASEED